MRFVCVLAALAGFAATAGADDDHALTGALDLSAVSISSPYVTWLDEGVGKLRYDDSDDGLQFTRAFLEYRGRLTSTLAFHGVLNAQDSKDKLIDFTEAYLEWRPIPRTAWRVRTRLGGFYPRLSLENVAAGWSSPYSLSASAINTWIGEELRTVGAEVRVSHMLTRLPASPELAFEGAVFLANDPTGALLTQRGWSLHDRQTGLTRSVPLPDFPAIAPWIPVPDNPQGLDPFREIDSNAGYYAGVEWRTGEAFRLKVFHYNNHGDPEATAGLDYAWQTRFTHVGLQFALPGDVGLIGQWMDGLTRMGPDLGPWHVWDSDFDARFVMLTRAFGAHRISARYDAFDVHPYNDPDQYTNRDYGYAWTASYLDDWSEHLRLGVEYLAIATEHCELDACAWVIGGLPRTSRQEQLQLSLRWTL